MTPKVQLGKSGGFTNIKADCTHGLLYIANSGVYRYAICKTCGKSMGEVQIPEVKDELQSKGKKGS